MRRSPRSDGKDSDKQDPTNQRQTDHLALPLLHAATQLVQDQGKQTQETPEEDPPPIGPKGLGKTPARVQVSEEMLGGMLEKQG
ncbi:hypothetical protein EBZ35_07045 [bacterium]|nr:hypothetical protein [bacterium]